MNESDDYLWDRRGEVDPEVARLEELLGPLAHRAPLDSGLRARQGLRARTSQRRPRRSWPIVLGGAVVAAAAVLALIAWWRSDGSGGAGAGRAACASGTGFAFSATTGTVACGGAELARGVLPIGTTLDTGSGQAELAIADIGVAHLGANTRVRLEHTSEHHHELFLERGSLHARVIAPPRIFAVATPSAKVTDLGCEYRLEVDAAGAGEIAVIAGMVELESAGGAFVVAPARTVARLLPGRRAGLPLAPTAGPELVAAVRAFEDGRPGALERVLAAATGGDAITIANLSQVAGGAERRTILARLAELFPVPDGTTLDQAIADPARFEAWRDEIVDAHLGVTLPLWLP